MRTARLVRRRVTGRSGPYRIALHGQHFCGMNSKQCDLTASAGRSEVANPRAELVTGRQLFAVLLVLFGFHVVLRWLVTETAGIDDADQILRAQIWSWGYGPQPPLYTWLTKIFLGTFGYSVVSMLLLKEIIIFFIYVLVYADTRQLTNSNRCALVATALLQTNFSIAWESHRELTHSVLASCLALAMLYAFLRLDAKRWGFYALFGACCGLGLLCKYNFAFLWVALMLGAVSVPEMRPLLFNRRMLLAIVLMLAVCAPHFAWFLQHRDLATSTVYKLKMIPNPGMGQLAHGLRDWVLAVVGHVGPMILLTGLLVRRNFIRLAEATPRQQVLWRMFLWILLLVSAGTILFHVTGLKERYVQPLLIWMPILLAGILRETVSPRLTKILLPLAAVAAGVILFAAPGRLFLTEKRGRRDVLNTPFSRLKQDLRGDIARADCVITENNTLGGNLRLGFADKLILDPEVGPLFPPRRCKGLLVWEQTGSGKPPDELLRFARSFLGSDKITEIRTCEEVFKYHQTRSIRLGAALVE